MKIKPDAIGETGLRFFGQMTASISHELKNIMAIIKENAGLLNDYLNMVAKGRPFDPDRFQCVANRIDAQTLRADTIIKDLNRFAHTVDRSTKPTSLNETLKLMVALHRRQATLHQVTLVHSHAQFDTMILCSPFLLLNVLGLTLTFALKAMPVEGTLTIAANKKENFAEICFSGLKKLEEISPHSFPAADEALLLNAIGAQVDMQRVKGQLLICLPLQ